MRAKLASVFGRSTKRSTRRSTKRSTKARSRTALRRGQRKVWHLIYREGGWVLKEKGSTRTFGPFDSKQKALQRGRRLAKSSGLGQLVVHKKNNVIQTEFTYGQDPRRSSG